MQNIVSPLSTQVRKKVYSLQDIIIKKIVEKGAQSPYDIINEISDQKKNPKSIERSVLRAFRTLQLEDKYGKKQIACEYRKKTYGNFRYYHNLTDDGIDWYIEKFGLSPDDFWQMSINLFKRNYGYRFAYENKQTGKLYYENSDKAKSKLEKWSFEKFYEEYKKRHNIHEKIFNPIGIIKTLSSVRNFLRRYFAYNENFFPVEFDYDLWRELLPILEAYIQGDSNKIKKVWLNGFAEHDQPNEEVLSMLKKDNILCTFTENGNSEEKITILGVLFYLVLIEFYSYPKKTIENMVDKLGEYFPLIFDKSIWSDLTQLQTAEELHGILIDPISKGFEEVFEESFTYTSLEKLHYLYYHEQKTHHKIKQLFKSGLKILGNHSKENESTSELKRFFEEESSLPEELANYAKAYTKFKELIFIFRQERDNDKNIFDHNPKNKELVIEPVSEFITYHFYIYLKQYLEKRDWEKFLKNNKRVENFFNEWNENISEI